MKECITHHFACECREEKFKDMERENKQLRQTVLETLNQRGQRELIVAWDRVKELERENAALRAAFKSAIILREHEDGRGRIQEYVQKGSLFSGEVVLLMSRTAFDAARKEAQP